MHEVRAAHVLPDAPAAQAGGEQQPDAIGNRQPGPVQDAAELPISAGQHHNLRVGRDDRAGPARGDGTLQQVERLVVGHIVHADVEDA